ncbi:hypothetical protein KZZ52_33630 [Dactylosporangium sp. AC04546]|uniref:hypothetical protein n=1 Tax=Dactylosporangium sp. AC04546 TaxID=2862460 RepID=UPI001EDD6916|nr:hypothetical protein [Dactylosporangium sp. AC04546]WVK78917.1 hypothetical protein KZZ52_33630 [Dactylosporangium sp. AC04546]
MIDHDMVCAICRVALNAIDITDSTAGKSTTVDATTAGSVTASFGNFGVRSRFRYEHPITPDGKHRPVPVPAHTVDDVYRRCHFCSSDEPVWQYRSPVIEAESVGGYNTVIQAYSTQWQVCWACADAIERDDLTALHRRAIAVMRWHPTDLRAVVLRTLHLAFLANREPGRALVTTSRWTPARLPAATLPKIRDRLAALYRGPARLPRPLHDPAFGPILADALDQGHLYWIDQEFTNLVGDVHRDLPDTKVTGRIVPAANGLLVWANPIDQRHDVAAVSWMAVHPSGWTVVCYRSIGADRPAAAMEAIRHEIGWLVPIHAVRLHPDSVVNGDDPLGALIATWLLVAQKLSDTTPAPVEASIRKAYARTRRPAPEVRLIRIKPKRATPTARPTADAGGGNGRATPDHRYWVSGHQRNQAYGPGRSLRQTIDIDPFLKGPDDKPIRASTTVRVLGSTRRGEPDDVSGHDDGHVGGDNGPRLPGR